MYRIPAFFFFDRSSGSVSFAIPQHPSDCKLFLDTAGKLKRYTVSLGYDYSLSKRTLVYAGAGYMHDKYDDFAATTVGSAYNYGVTAGLVHKF